MTTTTAAATFAQIERELGAGMVPRLFRLLEGQPVLLGHIWGQFRGVVLQGALPRVLKEMIGTVVAGTMHCDYVRAVHLHSLTIQGVEKAQLDAVARGDYATTRLSGAVRSSLRFAALAARTNASYALPADGPGGGPRCACRPPQPSRKRGWTRRSRRNSCSPSRSSRRSAPSPTPSRSTRTIRESSIGSRGGRRGG